MMKYQGYAFGVTTSVLHCRFPFPSVNHNDCVGDCLLCVFPLDSIRPAARREGEREEHIIETTCVTW